MADSERAGGPLQGFRARRGAGMNYAQPWLPELTVLVGRDAESSGLTISVWEDAGGQYPQCRTLYHARWNAPVSSAREALEICSAGVAAALAELFSSES